MRLDKMKFFHRHTFDPEKWALVSKVERNAYLFESIDKPPIGSVRKGHELVFSNTCTSCGDIAFRRVREME